MSKKLILVFGAMVFFSNVYFAYAGVRINEFLADPDSGSEWIELWNDSGGEVDLSAFTWTDLASPGADGEHESSPRGLSGTIPAGGFFVFEMNTVLNNSGDSIGLYEGGSLSDRITFGKVNGYGKDLDASAKGKSGALVSGSWQADQVSSKGSANSASNSSGNDDANDNDSADSGGTSSGSSTTAVSPKTVSSKITAEITARNLAYVGIPHAFSGKAVQGGQQIYRGRYFWNFGDGDFRETKVINTDKFFHTYFYPGDYKVIFEYYPDSFADMPDARTEMNIKVVAPQVAIARVGEGTDFFVELANNTGYEADLSGWVLAGSTSSFTIPKGTTLSANKKLIISGRISGLSFADATNLRLLTPAGEVAYAYQPYQNFAASARNVSKNNSVFAEVAREKNIIYTNSTIDLPAGVAFADTLDKEESNFFARIIWPVIFLALVGLASFAVIYLRRRKSQAPGNEFEILDE